MKLTLLLSILLISQVAYACDSYNDCLDLSKQYAEKASQESKNGNEEMAGIDLDISNMYALEAMRFARSTYEIEKSDKENEFRKMVLEKLDEISKKLDKKND